MQTRRIGCELFQLVYIRQTAWTGLKGYATWLDSGETGAIWIPAYWPKVEWFLAVYGSWGYGPHHDEPVFFVDKVSECCGQQSLRQNAAACCPQ